ncbi:Sodium/potassium-transporting ATPase subunit alpha [Seminavis robusta]|uniref:P-type sodium-transporting ATPase4 n=1 Tax=Seminavis robusta TaxID=568900 RepID=A0A9N8F194_9STRA|nr:Sodium/potassium-transporting ATPase subunit alpha [Seminavis robusta]|eukprot:Sro2319_g323130.1 Sodium/potassium-transporting ATPase subunit alpha (1066) ;mRNA; r:6069-9485
MGKKDAEEEEVKAATPWHAMELSAVYKELGKDDGLPKSGLTTAEAEDRLAQYGENKLSEKRKVTLLERIWKQVANVLVGILVFVAVVSAIRAATATDGDTILTNWIQVGLILFVITVNTAIGIIQEGSAEKAAEALKNMLSSDAIVIRDGKETKVPANLLVPGDVVMLGLGDRVPADLRMATVGQLATAEAALTGESVPIDKQTSAIEVEGDPMATPLGDRKNMCFSATLVAQGSGIGIIIATGDETEIGTINKLVSQVEEQKTNVLEQIDTVSTWLAVFICITAVATFFTAWKLSGQDPIEALSTSLVCAVAMIPEGLEAIVTMTYAWAVSNMAKNNAIIRALPAVETLGSVTVICSDKTGTLTQNIMSVVALVTAGKRYRNNVNASDRTPTNFVRDETYMAERAAHAKFKRARAVIAGGPSQAGQTGKRGNTFPFGVTQGFGATEHGAGTGNPTDDPDYANAPADAPAGGESPSATELRQALCGGVLCSKCVLGEGGSRQGEIGNPTELSILRASYFGDVNVAEMKAAAPIIAEVPFSSEYKFMATVHEPSLENDGADNMDALVVHVKGAPDRMVAMCKYQAKEGKLDKASEEPIRREFWIEQIAVLSSHGLRVLALCRGKVPKGSVTEGQQLGADFVREKGEWLTLVGLCAIMDPPRPECVQAVSEAKCAGVRICMITGDHRDTALAIGGQLGLTDEEHSEAITGPELDAMSDEELKVATKKYNVFARASPQNKIRIVKALQDQGDICGMTGDGVNDAPALKAANMGVAMGKEGTDVAREASDMILADDNFATIITAVREGRVVWDDLRKVLLVNTPINNAQGMSVLFGMLCGLKDTPLSSIQVLYCNLICAVTLGFVTAVEPAEDGIMNLPPRRLGKRLIGRFLFLRIVLGTVTLVATTVGSVFILKDFKNPDGSEEYELPRQRAQALNTLSFGAMSITLSARFAYNSSLHPRILTGNPICWWSIGIMAALQVFITYTPGLNMTIFSMEGMDGIQWAIVVGFMVLVLFVMEAEKSLRRYLASLGEDTDDREYGYFDEAPGEPEERELPAEVQNFGHDELRK